MGLMRVIPKEVPRAKVAAEGGEEEEGVVEREREEVEGGRSVVLHQMDRAQGTMYSTGWGVGWLGFEG